MTEMFDTKSSILIVDDFSPMRLMLKTLLTQQGYQNFLEAKSVDDAIEVLRESNVDIVISDYGLPGHSGIDLVRVIRGDDDLNQMPFLMVVSEAEKDKIEVGQTSGVDESIVKPFTGQALREKLLKMKKIHEKRAS